MKFIKLFRRKDKIDSPDDEESIQHKVAKECPILYEHRTSCGWSCGKGWYELLSNLSYKIEALHELYYKKYRVKVSVQDIKEKWSSLDIYVNVHIDQSSFLTLFIKFLDYIVMHLEKNEFQMHKVVDCPSYVNHVETELTKVEYVKEKHHSKNCSNVKCFERDGKYYKVADYDEYEHFHFEPTRLKLIYQLSKWCANISNRLKWKEVKPTRKQSMILGYVNAMVDEYVHHAEEEAAHTCENCGQKIGCDWSPLCETTGWIRKLCTSCAEKQDSAYYKNDDLWQHDKIIKTKDELAAERIEKNSKYSDEYEKEQAEYEAELKAAEQEEIEYENKK